MKSNLQTKKTKRFINRSTPNNIQKAGYIYNIINSAIPFIMVTSSSLGFLITILYLKEINSIALIFEFTAFEFIIISGFSFIFIAIIHLYTLAFSLYIIIFISNTKTISNKEITSTTAQIGLSTFLYLIWFEFLDSSVPASMKIIISFIYLIILLILTEFFYLISNTLKNRSDFYFLSLTSPIIFLISYLILYLFLGAINPLILFFLFILVSALNIFFTSTKNELL